MLFHKTNSKRLNFEGLENRNLLTGDVSVAVVSGELQIEGDAAANEITIKQNGGKWVVEGVGTMVNGKTTAESFIGVNRIKIDLGAGADSIRVTKGKIVGDFEINDADGATTIDLTKLKAKSIDIATGDGSDIVRLKDCSTIEDIAITTSLSGVDLADTISLQKTKAGTTISVDTGNGNDNVLMKSVASVDACIINTFESGESDDDIVTVLASRFKSVALTTGDGSDNVLLNKVNVVDDIEVNASHTSGDSGDDEVSVLNSKSGGSLDILTGDGEDSVTVEKGTFLSSINISTGQTAADGNDVVLLKSLKGGDSNIDCGDGTDKLTQTKVTLKLAQTIAMGDGDNDELVVTRSKALEVIYTGGANTGDTAELTRNKFAEESITGFAVA